VFSVFLFVANFVVYQTLVVIFDFTEVWKLHTVAGFLTFFSGGFIVASILGSLKYNWFTRTLYTVTAVWTGLFAYLFMVSILFGLLVMVPGLPAIKIGLRLLILAVAVSIYGFFHARNIKVKQIQVTIPNLPEAWEGRRVIWISDIHLGQLHSHRFAGRIVKKVNAMPHHMIFIGGDLFDGTGAPDINELVAPFRSLSAPLGSYFITGNHEEFGDSSKFIMAVKSCGIKVIQDELVDIDGVQLIGVDYRNASTAGGFEKILAGLKIDTSKPSILLKHEPKHLEVAERAGISLQISGHTHLGQQWPLGYLAQMIYKGYAYGLKNLKSMQVFTSSGVGTWGPPLRVGTDSEIVVFTFNAR
jgi:hypothetical protein